MYSCIRFKYGSSKRHWRNFRCIVTWTYRPCYAQTDSVDDKERKWDGEPGQSDNDNDFMMIYFSTPV